MTATMATKMMATMTSGEGATANMTISKMMAAIMNSNKDNCNENDREDKGYKGGDDGNGTETTETKIMDGKDNCDNDNGDNGNNDGNTKCWCCDDGLEIQSLVRKVVGIS